MSGTEQLNSQSSLTIESNGSEVKKPKDDKEKSVNDPASFQNQTKFELKVVNDGTSSQKHNSKVQNLNNKSLKANDSRRFGEKANQLHKILEQKKSMINNKDKIEERKEPRGKSIQIDSLNLSEMIEELIYKVANQLKDYSKSINMGKAWDKKYGDHLAKERINDDSLKIKKLIDYYTKEYKSKLSQEYISDNFGEKWSRIGILLSILT